MVCKQEYNIMNHVKIYITYGDWLRYGTDALLFIIRLK